MKCDAAGNARVDSKFRNLAFQYDANNRQKQSSATDGSGAVVSVYDAGGQRVATQLNNQLTNVLVYDASGKLVAEYGSAPPEANGTQYVTADHQGSPRAITNSSGAVVSRHDYAPFGEDLPAGIGMRSLGQNYSQPDSVRQKYAGMETDDGTGMRHTLWRQYDNLSARWTAPDPYGGSMSVGNPQSFNRYSYVENDPVNKTDPLGLMSGRDASQSWGDVAGLFWGNSGGFGGPETGRSIIAAREAQQERLIKARTDGKLAQHYLNNGNLSDALRIFNNNSDVGIFVNGEALWGSSAADHISATVAEMFATVNVVGGDMIGGGQQNPASGGAVESPMVIPISEHVDYGGLGPYGDGECVAFPKELADQQGMNLGQAKYNWWAGANVMENLLTIRIGTVVISGFDRDGRYRSLPTGNHAAIFLRPSSDGKGFWVWEQIRGRVKQDEKRNSQGGYYSNPYRYAVLAVVTPGRGSGRR